MFHQAGYRAKVLVLGLKTQMLGCDYPWAGHGLYALWRVDNRTMTSTRSILIRDLAKRNYPYLRYSTSKLYLASIEMRLKRE
jgi:hypothetical protein